MKDFRIVARIYNNQLRERREATGMGIYEFAQSIGMSGGDYGAYEAMKTSPLTSGRGPKGPVDVRWKKGALAIATALNVDPGVLWPESVRRIKKTISEVRVDEADIAAMLPPAESTPFMLLSAGEEAEVLSAAVESLTDREGDLIKLRYGEDKTLGEIADEWGLSRERVRQIEVKALNKLRRNPRLLEIGGGE